MTDEMTYEDGRERYTNYKVNGVKVEDPTTGGPRRSASAIHLRSGMTDHGSGPVPHDDSANDVEAALLKDEQARFQFLQDGIVKNRAVTIYAFSTAKPLGWWCVRSYQGWFYPPMKGKLFIERDTKHVIRLEAASISMPEVYPWPFSHYARTVELDHINVGKAAYLLPFKSETGVFAWEDYRPDEYNYTEFKDYRHFESESKIQFGERP
jgi:hypothetical protein